MEIKKLPDPASILLWDRKLREKPCERVKVFDAELAAVADVLKATCYVHRACGLAAPQIGDFRQIVVVHYPEDTEPIVMVNPEIDAGRSKGETLEFENCLSLPRTNKAGERIRLGTKVRRARDLVYSYQDLTGRRIEAEAHDMLARIIAHEVDHCEGIFYIDRISSVSRDFVLREYGHFLNHMNNGSAYTKVDQKASAPSLE
jgi:peptide deformylase